VAEPSSATAAPAVSAWAPPNSQVAVSQVGVPSAVVGRPKATPMALVALHPFSVGFLATVGHCQKRCQKQEVAAETSTSSAPTSSPGRLPEDPKSTKSTEGSKLTYATDDDESEDEECALTVFIQFINCKFRSKK
jgi:hypothetical protein